MSQRKLQQDIDKLLKKVKEGLLDFETVYEKFQSTNSENTSYREKLESDLKREIKKLQKHRDQIKTWLSKEDVKDRQTVLTENRRLIENGMERFKSVEKLMKTKQFSTEALTNPDIIKDPRELRKREQFVFIQECLEELQKQIEGYEAQEDEEQVERHEFHIHNLENILKLLQNNEMEPETVQDYQEDIKYYVENNDDPDFIEYDTIYEDMGCESTPGSDENRENVASGTSDSQIASTNATSSPSAHIITAKIAKRQERSPRKRAQQPTDTPSAVTTPIHGTPTPVSLQQSPTPESSTTLSQHAHTNGTTNSTDNNINHTNEIGNSHKKKDMNPTQQEVLYPQDKTEEINEQIERMLSENAAFKNPLFKDDLKYWLQSKRPLMQPYKKMPDRMKAQLESSLLNCPDSLDADSPHFYRKPLSLPHPTSIFFPSEPIRFVYPIDNVNPISVQEQQQQQQQQSPVKEQSSLNKPDDKRTEDKNIGSDENEDVYSRTSLARIFSKFDLDTLFFIFYHYQGTYEQFLAARELAKNRKWRFNKKDRRWYYKEVEKSPPGMPQGEEESWRYFDYQRSWLARRCNSEIVPTEEDFEKLF